MFFSWRRQEDPQGASGHELRFESGAGHCLQPVRHVTPFLHGQSSPVKPSASSSLEDKVWDYRCNFLVFLGQSRFVTFCLPAVKSFTPRVFVPPEEVLCTKIAYIATRVCHSFPLLPHLWPLLRIIGFWPEVHPSEFHGLHFCLKKVRFSFILRRHAGRV